MSNKVLQIRTHYTYGRYLLLPENDLAKQFAALMGCLTLPANKLPLIKALGYEINVTHYPAKEAPQLPDKIADAATNIERLSLGNQNAT